MTRRRNPLLQKEEDHHRLYLHSHHRIIATDAVIGTTDPIKIIEVPSEGTMGRLMVAAALLNIVIHTGGQMDLLKVTTTIAGTATAGMETALEAMTITIVQEMDIGEEETAMHNTTTSVKDTDAMPSEEVVKCLRTAALATVLAKSAEGLVQGVLVVPVAGVVATAGVIVGR